MAVRGTPFFSHWKTGVSVTPLGREREQVRVTVAPAITEDEGEEVSEMVADSVERLREMNTVDCNILGEQIE